MIPKSQRSKWRFQCFIILLFNRVRYSPISIRRWYRIDVDVIPLRGSSSGFPSLKVETVRSHLSCVIVFNLNGPNLRQISQNQIWDPGLLRLKLRLDIVAEDAETRRVNLVRYIVDWFSNFSGGVTIPEEEDVSMIQSLQSVYKLTSLMALTLFDCWFDPLRHADPVSITSLWVGWIQFTAFTSLISKTPLFENLRFKNLLTKRRLLFYLMVTGAYLFLRKRITMYGEIDLFFLALVLVEKTIRLRIRRIRRLNQQEKIKYIHSYFQLHNQRYIVEEAISKAYHLFL